MKLLSGKALSALLEPQLKESAAKLRAQGSPPALAVLRVGEDPASEVYVRNKLLAAERVGIDSEELHLPAETPPEALEAAIDRLNEDKRIHGMICQLPLPAGLDADALAERINPLKDVDCFHPSNFGLMAMGTPRFVPCTPAGILELLDHHQIPLAGQRVVVLGRSNIVGRPLALLLGHKGRDATVTTCHSRSRDVEKLIGEADVLIAALGQPQWVRAEMIGSGAVVVDVGIHRIADSSRASGSRLCGDVAREGLEERAAALTPVPGGVGPMTITMLLKNTLTAAELQHRTLRA